MTRAPGECRCARRLRDLAASNSATASVAALALRLLATTPGHCALGSAISIRRLLYYSIPLRLYLLRVFCRQWNGVTRARFLPLCGCIGFSEASRERRNFTEGNTGEHVCRENSEQKTAGKRKQPINDNSPDAEGCYAFIILNHKRVLWRFLGWIGSITCQPNRAIGRCAGLGIIPCLITTLRYITQKVWYPKGLVNSASQSGNLSKFF